MKEFTSIEDAPHIFDVINYWPQPYKQCLGTKDLPEGWEWVFCEFPKGWILSNGTIGLTRNDWDKHNNKMVAAQPLDPATSKQATPKGSGNPILGMVLADLTNRALEGKEKYGEPLLAHNGRNPLWDAYQEALDLAMYLRQAIEEQK